MQYFLKRLNSILIKPAGPDCNMACTYCFYLKKAKLFSKTKKHRMREDILEETIRQAMTQSEDQISFAWQGGEPTLMGVAFYEKAIRFQQRYGYNQLVGNGLQTNGLLIDRNWAKFLKRYKFLVGISLDGPKHVHNRYRKLKNGQGSWSKVVDKAKLLLDSGVAVNALTVVNDYSVRFPEEIYGFLKEMGLSYMQFIPCFETDPGDPKRVASFSAPPLEYGKFLCRVFDLWLTDFVNDKPTTSVRLFDSLFFRYVDMEPPDCALMSECGVYVVVEHNGDVYSCDFFVDPEWKLGNVMESNLINMLNSKRQHEFGNRKANLPEACQKCPWLKFCYGGCPKDRLRLPSDNNLNHFCQSYKIFFEHADPHFRKLAQDWRKRQWGEDGTCK